jgi:hypothetical protein
MRPCEIESEALEHHRSAIDALPAAPVPRR